MMSIVTIVVAKIKIMRLSSIFLWRVITLSFMVAGHTKFSCDRYFGLMEKKYRRFKIDTMHGITRIVSESSVG
jgi:hypothetical protein